MVDGAGKIVRETKVASEPEALIAWFRALGLALERIGLEAGPLSQWLYAALREAGFAVELLETRHVRDAFKSMPVKSDRNDARGIAQLMRLGWFRPVHCKSMTAQETACRSDGAQAVAVEAARYREQPAWRAAGLWPEGRPRPPNARSPNDPGTGCRPSRTGTGGKGATRGSCRATGRVQWSGETDPVSSPNQSQVQASDDHPAVGPIVALTLRRRLTIPSGSDHRRRQGRILA